MKDRGDGTRLYDGTEPKKEEEPPMLPKGDFYSFLQSGWWDWEGDRGNRGGVGCFEGESLTSCIRKMILRTP